MVSFIIGEIENIFACFKKLVKKRYFQTPLYTRIAEKIPKICEKKIFPFQLLSSSTIIDTYIIKKYAKTIELCEKMVEKNEFSEIITQVVK